MSKSKYPPHYKKDIVIGREYYSHTTNVYNKWSKSIFKVIPIHTADEYNSKTIKCKFVNIPRPGHLQHTRTVDIALSRLFENKEDAEKAFLKFKHNHTIRESKKEMNLDAWKKFESVLKIYGIHIGYYTGNALNLPEKNLRGIAAILLKAVNDPSLEVRDHDRLLHLIRGS